MGKNTLYLKYRPKQLEEVIGQPHIMETLRQSSLQDRFAHAYMFSGTKGCGKTTSARIVANLMNCENPADGKVCENCGPCNTIPFGTAMDIVELDGAKQRRVEDINTLIEKASWTPQELKRKVLIIDECHQLSPVAISSLLKIVEEPPDYLTFIFCTTEPQKIPDTILSRSQKHIFHRISSKNIAGRLSFIANEEGFPVDEGSLHALAQLGRGSMRDAIGYLEQIAIAAGDKPITEDLIYKYHGIADRKGVYDMIQSMASGNYKLLLDQVNDMIVASVDIRSILYEISEVFRNILVIKAQGGETRLVDLPDHEVSTIVKLGQSMGLGQLDKLSKEFSTIEKELTYSINKRLVMESALIRCTARLNLKK